MTYKIELDGGKYTVVNALSNGGKLTALRYDEEWRDLTGDNLLYAITYEIERLRKYVESTPSNCIDCGDTFQPNFAFEDGLEYCEGCGGYC